MKKGICLNSLPGEDLKAKFELAKRAGFEGVEPSLTEDAEEREKMKRAAEEAGMRVHSVMGGLLWKFPLSSLDDKVRGKGMEIVALGLEWAKELGAETLLVVPGVVDKETPYEKAYERSLAALKELAPLAEKAGVVICVENVWNRFLTSPLEMRKFVEEVGSDFVKAYFDVGNVLIYGWPEQWIRILGDLVRAVHVKDFDLGTRQFVHLLRGDVDWRAVREALLEIGYEGFLTVELPPYKSYPDQMVFDSSAALDRIIRGS